MRRRRGSRWRALATRMRGGNAEREAAGARTRARLGRTRKATRSSSPSCLRCSSTRTCRRSGCSRSTAPTTDCSRRGHAARRRSRGRVATTIRCWRIGYLSADFRDHVMGKLLLPVIEAHDRTPLRDSRVLARAPRELGRRNRAMEGRGRRIRQRRGARRSRGGRGDRGRRSRSAGRPDGPLGLRAARDPPLQAGAVQRHASRLPRCARPFAGRLQDHRPYADTPATARWQLEALLPIDSLRAAAAARRAGRRRRDSVAPRSVCRRRLSCSARSSAY